MRHPTRNDNRPEHRQIRRVSAATGNQLFIFEDMRSTKPDVLAPQKDGTQATRPLANCLASVPPSGQSKRGLRHVLDRAVIEIEDGYGGMNGDGVGCMRIFMTLLRKTLVELNGRVEIITAGCKRRHGSRLVVRGEQSANPSQTHAKVTVEHHSQAPADFTRVPLASQ